MDEKKQKKSRHAKRRLRKLSQTLKPKPVNVNAMRKLKLVNVNMKARVTDMAGKKKLNG